MLLSILNALCDFACRLFGHADHCIDAYRVRVRWCLHCRRVEAVEHPGTLGGGGLQVYLFFESGVAVANGRATAPPRCVYVRELPSS